MKRFTKVLLASIAIFLFHSNVFSKSIVNTGNPKELKITKTSFCTFSVTVTSTLVYCYGGNTGTALASPSGGTPPYTYSWAPSGGNAANATGLTAGNYTVTVTDFVGCTSTASVMVMQPSPLATLTLYNDTVCTGSCTGVLSFAFAGGGTAPYTFVWSNGQTNYTATGLCAGSYTGTITDADGCSASETASVVIHSNIPTFTVVPTITNATCAGSSDGSISLACSGPTAPFRFEWQNKYYTGNSFNNLAPGTYSVIITDALYNCTPLTYTVGVNYTCGAVSGKTFNDTNFNCTYNAGEPGINNSYITINPGAYVVYPDINGNYKQQNLPYGSYTVTQTMSAGSPFSPCITTQPVTVSAVTPSTNFADTTHTALSDPMITYFYTSNLFVGSTCNAAFQIVNNGSAFSNGRAFFTVPDSLSLITTVPAYSLISNDTIYWNYSGLLPGDTLNYSINCKIADYISLNGFATCGFAGVIPSNPESNSGNNTTERCDFIGVPCDPNNKSVYPTGIGPNGYINLTDSILTYIIHFQNVGSAKATNVYVVDTISSHLDMSTLNVLGASNAFSYT
ncbi:MAG TPA: SprB repeat-containing protein, partial [Bacteroidia bacterium]|nr:SprB repeat-containing protein [Bacteroidia bacterium]